MTSEPSSSPAPPETRTPAPAPRAKPSRSIASYLLGLIGRAPSPAHMGTANAEPPPTDPTEGPPVVGDPAASEELRQRRGEAFGGERRHPAA